METTCALLAVLGGKSVVPAQPWRKQRAPFWAGQWTEISCQYHRFPKRAALQNCQQDRTWISKNICMVSSCKNAERICTSFCSQVHKSPFLPEPRDPKHEERSASSPNILPGCDPSLPGSWAKSTVQLTDQITNTRDTWEWPRSLESKAKGFAAMCEGVWLDLRYRRSC